MTQQAGGPVDPDEQGRPDEAPPGEACNPGLGDSEAESAGQHPSATGKPEATSSSELELLEWSWKPVELAPELTEDLSLRFQASVYEAVLRDTAWKHPTPQETELLFHLDTIYSKLCLVQEGLRVGERLTQLHPEEPLLFYNLACRRSLLGEVDSAFEALRRAIDLGYQNFQHLVQDRDLDNLKRDARFAALLRELESSG